MKVLFLIQGYDTAASRYRVLQFLPLLEAQGMECEVRVHPRGILASAASALSFGDFDAVFVQRKRFGALGRAVARRTAARLIFDFDDSIMYRNSLAASPFSPGRMRSFRKMAAMCHHICVGNTYLRDQTATHTDAGITVVPTVVDADKYVPKDHSAGEDSIVTIGWIGAHGSIHYLSRLKPAFDAMHRKDSRLRLKVVCDTFMKCDSMPVVEKPWSAEDELDDLLSFDIGVMPLLEDPWSQGKCGLKIVQCLGAGVPVVCTPVGVNRDIVQDGAEGFWARTEGEWVDKVLALAADRGLRASMGAAGRKKVVEGYSVKAAFPLLAAAIRGAC